MYANVTEGVPPIPPAESGGEGQLPEMAAGLRLPPGAIYHDINTQCVLVSI
jgi:hypothetical protein